MADSTVTPRKRSRAACLSCQSRKRKCSGEKPCATCIQAGVECQYNSAPRRKHPRTSNTYNEGMHMLELAAPRDVQNPPVPPVQPSAVGSVPSPASYNRIERPRNVSQSLEVNSGAAFVRKLGLRIDPANAPRLNLFAWNVGQRRLSPTLSSTAQTIARPITRILSQEEMRRLATVYFEKVDPCYPFLDRKIIFPRIAHRWLISASEEPEQDFDAILYGVAALGFLFSRREIMDTELHLVEAARKLLEKSVLCAETPSVETVAGWVLRAAYLRMTASPHAAWMASCTLMHMIEAAGIHLESSDPESTGLVHGPSNAPNTNPTAETELVKPLNTPDTRRRLYGMARHLNTWISFDLGRSRVVLHGATAHRVWPINPNTSQPPSSSRADIFHLLPLSENLDPTGPTPQDLPELEAALNSVLDIVYTDQSLILVQCNLMLCIYRRVRALNAHPPLSTKLFDRVLALAGRGLRAARGMVASSCPWHQVANVPFQVVCTLLAIDNRAALALLPDAMQTLREVLSAYETDAMREAYSTAYLLIALHQRRKEDDTRALGAVLRANAGAAGAEQRVSSLQGDGGVIADGQQVQQPPLQPVNNAPVSNLELSWLGDLVIDMPSLQNFDLDQFLMTDVPWPLPEMGI